MVPKNRMWRGATNLLPDGLLGDPLVGFDRLDPPPYNSRLFCGL
jgi:hypothetical protein